MSALAPDVGGALDATDAQLSAREERVRVANRFELQNGAIQRVRKLPAPKSRAAPESRATSTVQIIVRRPTPAGGLDEI